MAFQVKDSQPGATEKKATPTTTAITYGMPLKVTNNAFAVATSGATVWYLANGTKSVSDAATTAIDAERVVEGKVYIADIGTGTMEDSYVDTAVDLKTGAVAGLDLTSTSNGDFLITGWDGVDTAKCWGVFTDAAF